jgi:hypothetical protein
MGVLNSFAAGQLTLAGMGAARDKLLLNMENYHGLFGPHEIVDMWNNAVAGSSSVFGATVTDKKTDTGINKVAYHPVLEQGIQQYWKGNKDFFNQLPDAYKGMFTVMANQWILQHPEVGAAGIPQEAWTRYNTIQTSFQGHDISKNFVIQTDYFSRMTEARKDNTGASDMALVFSFMKVLDPTSVVRESEYATAENAAGVPSQARSLWNKLVGGGKLDDTARAQIYAEAVKYYNASAKGYQSLADFYDQRIAIEAPDYVGGKVYRIPILQANVLDVSTQATPTFK